MMSPNEIVERFPNLAVGEVIYVCPDGMSFTIGSEDNKLTLARKWCWKNNLKSPEKVIGVSLETEELQEDSTNVENKPEKAVIASKPVTKKRTSKKK